jgi:hypothetical protein
MNSRQEKRKFNSFSVEKVPDNIQLDLQIDRRLEQNFSYLKSDYSFGM